MSYLFNYDPSATIATNMATSVGKGAIIVLIAVIATLIVWGIGNVLKTFSQNAASAAIASPVWEAEMKPMTTPAMEASTRVGEPALMEAYQSAYLSALRSYSLN